MPLEERHRHDSVLLHDARKLLVVVVVVVISIRPKDKNNTYCCMYVIYDIYNGAECGFRILRILSIYLLRGTNGQGKG